MGFRDIMGESKSAPRKGSICAHSRRRFAFMLAGALAYPTLAVGARDRLRIAAASSFQYFLPAVIKKYANALSTHVDYIFGSSGQLAQQIVQGAPFDLYISADGPVMHILVQRLVSPGSILSFAKGVLVLIHNGRCDLAQEDDCGSDFENIGSDLSLLPKWLDRHSVRYFAMANPRTAPYGRAAQQVLERLELWQNMSKSLLTTESVAQVTGLVRSGNAPIGLSALSTLTDGLTWDTELKRVMVSPKLHGSLEAQILPLTNNRQTAQMVELLTSDEVRGLLPQFGFESP